MKVSRIHTHSYQISPINQPVFSNILVHINVIWVLNCFPDIKMPWHLLDISDLEFKNCFSFAHVVICCRHKQVRLPNLYLFLKDQKGLTKIKNKYFKDNILISFIVVSYATLLSFFNQKIVNPRCICMHLYKSRFHLTFARRK